MHIRLIGFFVMIGSSLMAQGVRINGGVHGGLALPTGTFATAETPSGDHLGANRGAGAQIGGHLDINLTVHHQVRFNVTIQAFVDGSEDRDTSYSGSGSWHDWDDDWDDWFHRSSSSDNKNAVSNVFGILQAGCDYVYNFQSPSKGPYVLAGIHINSLSKATTLPTNREFTSLNPGA
ncbi:MAG: hypothetical protein Q8O00_05550 [Holophaga sp.]|nr:hypothetical protein [Holophaga sp.]